MGLDSVELVIEIEKYFGIEIPNKEAEEIRTVQQMVDCVARHLHISNQDITLKHEIFEKLKSILIQIGLAGASFSLSYYIFNYIKPGDKDLLAQVSKQLELKIPQPFIAGENFIKRVVSAVWQPQYDWKTVTADQFITALCVHNYEKLINRKSLKSTYEIFVVIAAITIDKIGVDVYEVRPDKDFIEDFGID